MQANKVTKWQDSSEEIDTNCMISVAEWCRSFGNNRLPNDVGRPLERCTIGLYQIGYLFDYCRIDQTDPNVKKGYLEEGIASVLVHLISSFEMTNREFIKVFSDYPIWKAFSFKWNDFVNPPYGFHFIKGIADNLVPDTVVLANLSEWSNKYLRWMVYNHMKREKRWDEKAFNESLFHTVCACIGLSQKYNLDLANGFALAMSKLQDGEIKRH